MNHHKQDQGAKPPKQWPVEEFDVAATRRELRQQHGVPADEWEYCMEDPDDAQSTRNHP